VTTRLNLVLLAVMAAGAAAVAFAVLKSKAGAVRGEELKFKQKALLTANELEFLGRLEAAVPELRFCPQVAMGALLEPAVSRKDGSAYFRLRGMFSQKITDFVAQRREDGAVVAVIELDDRTHNPDKDAKRDIMLTSAGYKVIRWNSKTKPDANAIRLQLMPSPPVTPARSDAGA
jgi:very-short-patch-repair endonuclease